MTRKVNVCGTEILKSKDHFTGSVSEKYLVNGNVRLFITEKNETAQGSVTNCKPGTIGVKCI